MESKIIGGVSLYFDQQVAKMDVAIATFLAAGQLTLHRFS